MEILHKHRNSILNLGRMNIYRKKALGHTRCKCIWIFITGERKEKQNKKNIEDAWNTAKICEGIKY